MSNKALTTTEYWDSLKAGSHYPRLLVNYADRDTARVFDPFMSQKRGGRVLELGCGNSYFLPYFANRYGMKVAGIDNSGERIRNTYNNVFTQTHLIPFEQDMDFRLADVRALQPDWVGTFDVVYSRGLVEHFTDSSLLLIVKEYLKPDGLMITTVPNLVGFWGGLDRHVAQLGDDHPYIRMSLAALRAWHLQADLHIVHSQYFRLLDLGMLNWSKTPKLIQTLVAYYIGGSSILRLPFDRLRIRFPEGWYTDMIVVAKK